MSDADEAIRNYYSLMPSRYGFLESFRLQRAVSVEGSSDYLLELQLRSLSDPKEERRLHLTFSGTKDLQVRNLEGLLSLMIDIRSVEGDQLEDIRYRVAESEFGAFSFLCSGIKAIVE